MKVLRSATVDWEGKVEVVYDREVGGNMKPTNFRGRWPEAVKTAGAALIVAADAVSDDDPSVKSVQVYGEVSGGKSEFCENGERVDLTFSDNRVELIGDTEEVPEDLAEARDAFKDAVMAALEAA